MHTANGEDFYKILKSGEIRAARCPVFVDDDLVYFFLGRPAYKTPLASDPSYWQLPAVFVFRTLDDFVPARIFPFDSGAFSDDRFREIIGKVDVTAFDIKNKDQIALLIGTFFESIDRYEKAQPEGYDKISQLLGNDLSNYAPLALAKLYNHNLNHVIDDRSRLIEVQYTNNIPLRSASLKGVICCREWLRDPKIETALADLGCKVSSYPILPLSTACYYSKIYELASDMQ